MAPPAKKKSSARKGLLIGIKLLVAAALLTWVLGGIAWRDYVVVREGKPDAGAAFAVIEEIRPSGPDGVLQAVRIVRGMLWWQSDPIERPVGDFVPTTSDPGAEPIRNGFLSSITGIRPGIFSLAVAGFFASLLVIAWRLSGLLRVQKIDIRLWELVRLTFLGQFFNAVMPSTVGGDLIKAYYIAKHTRKKAPVLVTVFLDRVLGLTSLAIIAAVMLVAVLLGGLETFQRVRMSVYGVLIMGGALVMGLLFMLSSRFRQVFHLQSIYKRLPIAHHIEAAGQATRLFRSHPASLIKAVAVTMIAQGLWIGSVAAIGWSLALPSEWFHYFVYTPLVYVIGAIPISPGGVGLVESMFLTFFGQGTAKPEAIVAMAVLARAVQIFWGLPGILVVFTGTRVPKADTMEAELGLADPAASADEEQV